MPPEGKPLTGEQLAVLRAWITQGAVSPNDEQPERDPREHWAFQAPKRPPLPEFDPPAGDGSEQRVNPIDAFIAADHRKHGFTARPPARRAILLRRVYLDLIGLPPTRRQLQAFLADESEEAYDKVVASLLASPQYGERWARHWMDIWRYSDWYGRRSVPDVWNSAPQIWRWRDWIVNSLNDDKGYERMIQEMLAADEICPEDAEASVATGYLVRNWYALNPNDWMRNNVEHTAKAFLALTMNCAHCHDHKYDPISQDDYFRLRAFFEPIGIRQDRAPGEADPGPFQVYEYGKLRKIVRLGAVTIHDKNPDAPTWLYLDGDERNRQTERGSIAPGAPEFLAAWAPKIEPFELPPRAWYPGLRPTIQTTVLDQCRKEITQTETALAAARKTAEMSLPPLRETLKQAESELATAEKEAEKSGRGGALAGRQSLVLDASSGRAIVQHRLQQVKALDDGAAFTFQLMILQDAHVNFQLAKDVAKGLTASYVGFRNGSIIAYEPGGFNEFKVGEYDFAAGQNRFLVELVLQTEADRCLLTVRSMVDDAVLVDGVPVTLNGWSPVGDSLKAISFDARPGTVAVVDDVALIAPRAESKRLAYFDFEPPKYASGGDAVGIEGWEASPFAQAPAFSVVSTNAANDALGPIMRKVSAARRAVDVHQLSMEAAEAKQLAKKSELASIEARIAADRAKYGETPDADAAALAQTASQLEREAAVKLAETDVLAKDQLLAVAETKPVDDAKRAKEMEAAKKQLAAARVALTKSQTALADEAKKSSYAPLSLTYAKTTTGRRRALAGWITDSRNPLTARVAVNHVWMRHFHAPLVSSVYDFGLNGARPTHPKLLDWLAVEFMESGWSMKHLHRLIVTSDAYRRTSRMGGDSNAAYEQDPENKHLWRMNAGRMEAEIVRDSLLFCAGRLDLQLGGQELENKQALTTRRRSLYYSCNPELDGKSQFGALFDAPNALECYRRTRSIVPQQALALTNSELVHQLSETLAKVIWEQLESTTDKNAFITVAFEQILSRIPTSSEIEIATMFLATQNELIGKSNAAEAESRARESLVRALLNHNDFVTIR